MKIDLIHGDCLEEMKKLADNSVDSIVTDPPYGLSFMGKKWDYDVPSEDIWRECLRVLKPGGHLLAFAGTRTQHRMAVRIEDAGFEIRDMIAWVYGSGFPKSLNIGKAVDKLQGNEREVVGSSRAGSKERNGYKGDMAIMPFETETIDLEVTKGNSPWEGWGTALKPALEPITVARKPLTEKTVAQNVLKHGTGGINIDGCRVGVTGARNNGNSRGTVGSNSIGVYGKAIKQDYNMGRFPANLIHDGSDEVVELFPTSKGGAFPKAHGSSGFVSPEERETRIEMNDEGSAARFFYCAKASKKDRDEGLEGFEAKNNMRVNGPRESEEAKHSTQRANHHPTVKPTDLMRYLCRLVTPLGGTILDPFMGSGSTGKAAKLEGFGFIGIEREAEYVEIAQKRINETVTPLLT